MKQITLNIPDNRFKFFMELMKDLKYVSIKNSENEDSKSEILNGIKQAVDEVKLAKKGKIKLQSAHDLLNEL